MTYLPLLAPEATVLPREHARDISTQIRLIAEQFRRYCPATDYYTLSSQVTPVAVTADNDRTPSGTPGTTLFDSVYGEMLPANATKWVQPHGTAGVTPATALEVFLPPLRIHSRRQRVSKETDLKKYGFDKQRDLLITIPLSLLDDVGVTVGHGDKFIWNQVEYRVMDFNKHGYWGNTDVSLYMVINANQYRKGS